MDSGRVGSALRALRVRRGWRQVDVARRAGVSRALISLVERGHLESVTVGALARIALALDARFDPQVRWRGGDLIALVNGRHSAMHESFARWADGQPGWRWYPEVSFSRYGERGIVDVIGWHEEAAAILVVELKSELVDIQEHLGTLDRKTRLASAIALERGWSAHGAVGAWLVLAPGRTTDRRLAAHRSVIRAALPGDVRAVRRWLREPVGPLRALSNLPDATDDSLRHRAAGPRRVRRGSSRAGDAARSSKGRVDRPS